jgi:hypothetical protein
MILREKRSRGKTEGDCHLALASDEIQGLHGRVTAGEEPGEGQSTGQGGASFPDREVHLRIREDSLPRAAEESLAAVPQLRTGQPVSAPQTSGPQQGVVSPNP